MWHNLSMITVEKVGARWIARSTYAQKDIVKSAGFRWDREDYVWYTCDPAIAAKLGDSDSIRVAIAEHEKKQTAKAASIEASRAADWSGEIPCPAGRAYLPYQRAGIAYAMARQSTLFGDEMGLGKTIQAIGVINADETIKRVLVICPASLKLNWRRELERWLTRSLKSIIADGKNCPVDAATEILIVNYDIADKHSAALRSIPWDCLIVDEAHYLKNDKAKRTKAILGAAAKKGDGPIPGIRAQRKLFLTGTPIPNRPIEGWTIFSALAPDEFRSFWGYAKRYCNATQGSYGWDMTGSANLGELQDKLRASIMVRRLKKDVLTELPAKRRAVVEISQNGASKIVAAEQNAYAAHEAAIERTRAEVELAKAESVDLYERMVAELREAVRSAFTELSKVRHQVAVAKIPHVVEHLRNALEGGKVVVFAHHRDVVAGIMAELENEYGAVKVTGEDSMQDRQAAVDRFQSDDSCRLFVGNIQAAGVGITLTAASHVVFAELDWVPGNVSQAEDRCHRIGQRDMVLVEHLVLDGSLDAQMAHTIVEKQAVIDEALDNEHSIDVVAPRRQREKAATEDVTRRQIEAESKVLTDDQIQAIHAGLRMLAEMDEDHASELNGYGYSKMDCMIGHSLAKARQLSPRQAVLGAKLVRRYRRQLPAELVERAKSA